MHRPDNIGAAPDYTNAFLVSAGALLYVFLCFIWAIWGLIPALVLSAAANRAMPRRVASEDAQGE